MQLKKTQKQQKAKKENEPSSVHPEQSNIHVERLSPGHCSVKSTHNKTRVDEVVSEEQGVQRFSSPSSSDKRAGSVAQVAATTESVE